MSSEPVKLYISKNENACPDGSFEKPYASLMDASIAVRKHKAQMPDAFVGGVEFVMAEGDYPLSEGLVFNAQDSGTANAPVIIRAAAGARVRLLGGVDIAPEAFVPVTEPAVKKRLKPNVRHKVLQLDLKTLGMRNLGKFVSRGFNRPVSPSHLELFFNDRVMTVAQWPKAGEFLTISNFVTPQTTEWKGQSGELSGGFFYDGKRPQNWEESDDIWVHGYWAYDWANSYERVSRLDASLGRVETAPPHGLYYFSKGQRFYFLNILEELDQPGEYFVDRHSGVLYFLPPEDTKGADILLSCIDEPLMTFQDVQHMTVLGITLEAGRGSIVRINQGNNVCIDSCILRNSGNWAVQVDGGHHHVISACEIYGLGDGGVQLNGGDRQTLTACDHLVRDCHIHHFARWSRCYVPGIIGKGVGMRFANNCIHDAPHNAILFAGNEFTVENNEIYRVCLETGDAGAIYTGRDFTFRGNIVRRNFIHHMGGVGMGSIAIYMDDCVSGTRITENILWKCQFGIMLGGGRDFLVDNNIFVECDPAIHADARGIDSNPVWQNMIRNYMKQQLDVMNINEPPYSECYPEISGIDQYYETGDGVPPENNRVERNICWKCDTWISDTWPKGASNGITETNNLVNIDPKFVKSELPNGRLMPDSHALALGFKPIAFESIGPTCQPKPSSVLY